MISIIKNLFYDKDLVKTLKDQKTDKHVLYQQVISGKITLQEYLAAVKLK